MDPSGRKHDSRGQPDREVEPEDRSPRAKEPEDQRTPDRAKYPAECIDRRDEPERERTPAHRNDVRNKRHRHWQHRATAEALQRSPKDHCAELAGHGGHDRPHQEQHKRRAKHWETTEEIGQPAGQRHSDGVGNQVGEHDPRVAIGVNSADSEVSDDTRKDRSYDREVQRGQKYNRQNRQQTTPGCRILGTGGRIDVQDVGGGWMSTASPCLLRSSVHATGFFRAPSGSFSETRSRSFVPASTQSVTEITSP